MPFPLHWHTEPLLLLTILGAGWIYAILWGPLRTRWTTRAGYLDAKDAESATARNLQQPILFYSGLALIYLAVGSPIDQIGEEYLFSVHMVQHMLLIYVAPPLLFWGIPCWMLDGLFQNRILRKTWSIFVHPVFAGVSLTFLYTLWHVPGLYEAALHDKWLHVLEHWCMFLPAIWMWWPILSRSRLLPPSAYGVRMLYIFLLMVGQLPVFGFLTLSNEVLYPTYAFAPRIVELSPMQDQILGGIIMKITNMVISLSILGASFYSWYRADQRASDAAIAVPAS